MVGTGTFTQAYNKLGPTTKIGLPIGLLCSILFIAFWYLRGELKEQISKVEKTADDNKALVIALQTQVAVLQSDKDNVTNSLTRIESKIENSRRENTAAINELRKDIIQIIKESKN